MEKDSLRKVRIEIFKALDNADISQQDKMELVINLYHFLDEDKYLNNIKVLRQNDIKPMKNQISIDEYVKTLKPKGNKNE